MSDAVIRYCLLFVVARILNVLYILMSFSLAVPMGHLRLRDEKRATAGGVFSATVLPQDVPPLLRHVRARYV